MLAWHLCDFKHVVSGATKKRKFLIKNDSESGRLSWSVDKKLLTNTGFSVDHAAERSDHDGRAASVYMCARGGLFA